jgi:hypothetical protein
MHYDYFHFLTSNLVASPHERQCAVIRDLSGLLTERLRNSSLEKCSLPSLHEVSQASTYPAIAKELGGVKVELGGARESGRDKACWLLGQLR